MRTAQVECIVYRINNNQTEYLLLKRIPAKGGFWQPVTGGIEEDDKLEAAYREVMEETGIQRDQILRTIEDVHYFVMDKNYLTNKPIPRMEEFVYAFEVHPDTEVSIHNNIYPEHEEFQWVNYETALRMLKWDSNKDAFKKLFTLL